MKLNSLTTIEQRPHSSMVCMHQKHQLNENKKKQKRTNPIGPSFWWDNLCLNYWFCTLLKIERGEKEKHTKHAANGRESLHCGWCQLCTASTLHITMWPSQWSIETCVCGCVCRGGTATAFSNKKVLSWKMVRFEIVCVAASEMFAFCGQWRPLETITLLVIVFVLIMKIKLTFSACMCMCVCACVCK